MGAGTAAFAVFAAVGLVEVGLVAGFAVGFVRLGFVRLGFDSVVALVEPAFAPAVARVRVEEGGVADPPAAERSGLGSAIEMPRSCWCEGGSTAFALGPASLFRPSPGPEYGPTGGNPPGRIAVSSAAYRDRPPSDHETVYA